MPSATGRDVPPKGTCDGALGSVAGGAPSGSTSDSYSQTCNKPLASRPMCGLRTLMPTSSTFVCKLARWARAQEADLGERVCVLCCEPPVIRLSGTFGAGVGFAGVLGLDRASSGQAAASAKDGASGELGRSCTAGVAGVARAGVSGADFSNVPKRTSTIASVRRCDTSRATALPTASEALVLIVGVEAARLLGVNGADLGNSPGEAPECVPVRFIDSSRATALPVAASSSNRCCDVGRCSCSGCWW